MTGLFVSEDGTDIRICKRDEQGHERCICCVGLMGDYLYGEPTEETLAEWRYYARLFAQAEKMKEALAELVACKDLKDRMMGVAGKTSDVRLEKAEYGRREPEAWRRARGVALKIRPCGVRTWIIQRGLPTRNARLFQSDDGS